MDFDHQAVCPGGDGGFREDGHQRRDPGGMARVDDDGEVGLLFQKRDRRNIKGVPGGGLKGADPPLTKDDVRVPP